MWVFTIACVMALAGKHVRSSCPMKISPPAAVVRFGDPLWANCTALTEQVQGMGWESSLGGSPLTVGVKSLALNIESVTHWGLNPLCFINMRNNHQCMGNLLVTVYKMPDKVSLSGHAGPLVQDREYEMRCDVFNVAPVKNLLVHWYKGNTIISTHTFDDLTVYPVNKSSAITLLADRGDHGMLIWCEATMSIWLRTELPANRSQAYKMEVLFPPTFHDATDEVLELQDNSPLILNCTASGNPAPVYSWRFPEPTSLTFMNESTTQPVLMPILQFPGVYTCTVLNSQGTATKAFTAVVPKRDSTTFAAIVAVFVAMGLLIVIAGLYFVTPEGTFAFNKGAYQRGQQTSAGPV